MLPVVHLAQTCSQIAARRKPPHWHQQRSADGATLAPGNSRESCAVRRTLLVPMRGLSPSRNLGTRLRKVDDGEHDAIVLASAGLIRLEHRARISSVLPVRACVPAPGQGIIAVEIREGDQRAAGAIGTIDDEAARAALDAERAVVTRLGG